MKEALTEMRRPDFLVIGAMKSATTSLCELLSCHPSVYIAEPREPEFFCRDDKYAEGYAWYSSLFAPAAGQAIAGEGSTSYSKHSIFPQAAERIARDLPHVKLIYIVRHPLDRIVSHWMHLRAAGAKVPSDFGRSLLDLPHLVDTSLYWKQISVYRRFFCDDQIRVYFFEEFRRDPVEVVRDCQRFLGVEAADPPAHALEPKHRTDEKLREHSWIRAARRSGTLTGLLRKVPRGVREPLRRWTGQKMDAKPCWPPGVRERVVEKVGPDAAAFCAHFGKPADYWKL